jgi:peptide/nickel transport system ATP-binding protein
MPGNALNIRGLSFGYSADTPLFSDFDLSLNQGEIVALVGPSGSGKSTLLELISGSLRPRSGTIERAKFSQVFQDPYTSFHPGLNIWTQILDVCGPPEKGELSELLVRLGLSETFLKRKPHELSGGQLQRLSILRALLMKPGLLLCDEPTSALDNVSQLEVMRLIVGLLDRVGVLLITHDRDLAAWCADTIVALKGA